VVVAAGWMRDLESAAPGTSRTELSADTIGTNVSGSGWRRRASVDLRRR